MDGPCKRKCRSFDFAEKRFALDDSHLAKHILEQGHQERICNWE